MSVQRPHNSTRQPGVKVRTPMAMSRLTAQIRRVIPFDELNDARVCGGLCLGCPKKLLEYLEQEIIGWEQSVSAGEVPTLGDVERLARSSRKIYRVLQKNRVLPMLPTAEIAVATEPDSRR